MILLVHIPAFWPDTFAGWVAVAVGVTIIATFVAGIVGGLIALNKEHIQREVKEVSKKEVREAVDDGIAPLVVAMDTLRYNREEDVSAILGATDRIQELEVTINNGLTHATKQTRDDVEGLKVTVGGMQILIAEIHGWMKATYGD